MSTTSAAPSPIEVAAALLFRDGKLLIARRPAGGHLAGLWEFPGGKREAGESWEDCLRRELKEELDVEAAVGPLYQEVSHVYPEKAVRLRFFLCRLSESSGDPRPVGCAAVAWVSRGGFGGYEFPPADAGLLTRLSADAGVWGG